MAKTAKAPVQKANITILSKSESIYLGPTVALEDVNELTSFANYVTISRAINPTRRIFQPDPLDASRTAWAHLADPSEKRNVEYLTEKIDSKTMARMIDTFGWFRSKAVLPQELIPFIQLVASLHPSQTQSMVLQTALIEEELAMKKYNVRESEQTGPTNVHITNFFRFYKSADRFMMEKPIGPILDAAFQGFLYNGKEDQDETKGFGKFNFFAEHHVDPFNHSTLMDLFFANGSVDDKLSPNLKRFVSGLILVDFLQIQPKIVGFMSPTEMTLIQKDPQVRLDVTRKVSRLIRYISMQPIFMYAKMIADLLEHPEARLTITPMTSNFYNSTLYTEFKKRTDSITLGDVYNHIIQDCGSGLGTTRFGEHNVLRFPIMIKRMFSDLTGLIGATAATAAVDGIVKNQTNRVPSSISTMMDDITRFMREFIRLGYNEEDWTEFHQFAGAMGYTAPRKEGPAVDYLNPNVILSDGWTASDPVGYVEATRNFSFTPLLNSTGGPEKFAITYDPELTPTILGAETSVKSVVYINSNFSNMERDLIAKKGINALGKSRPVLWIVRHAEYHQRNDDEIRLALNARLPMSMYNGDADILHIPHTTMEDFANDIGMSPEGLISLINPSSVGEANRVSKEVKAMLQLFFKFHGPKEMKDIPSIYQIGSNYEALLPNVSFAAPWYFISKRSAVLQFASSVSLQPMTGRTALTLTSREISSLTKRTAQVFVTAVAEPWQPLIHQTALSSLVQFDEEWAQKWSCKFPAIN